MRQWSLSLAFFCLFTGVLSACKSTDQGAETKQLWDLDPVEVEIEDPPPPPPLGPEPQGKASKYPIVIANGMISNGETLKPVVDALRKDGHKVFMTQVPAAHPVRVRVPDLRTQVDQILKSTGAKKINILAYSLGALDARLLASTYRYGDRIASITTISGVNKGTPAGTAAHRIMMTMPGDWRKKIDAFASLIGANFVNPMLDKSQLTELAYDISLEGAEKFQQKNPNVASVYYQSYAGLSSFRGNEIPNAEEVCGSILGGGQNRDRMNLSLYLSMKILGVDIDGVPSDGAIPVENQKIGEFRGCVPIDHWGIIGSTRALGPDEYTGFELIRFYRNLVFDLSQKGF